MIIEVKCQCFDIYLDSKIVFILVFMTLEYIFHPLFNKSIKIQYFIVLDIIQNSVVRQNFTSTQK